MTKVTDTNVTVQVAGIAGEIEAKLDTGAEQTSLHAENIKVENGFVTFQLNERIYRAEVESESTISSADGGESSRPVIRSMVTIGDKDVDSLINLNDRGDMPHKMLIGKDVIESAGIVIELSGEENEEHQEQPSNDKLEIFTPVESEEEVPGESDDANADINQTIASIQALLDTLRKQLSGSAPTSQEATNEPEQVTVPSR